jgi:hypothetical protein
MTRPKKEDTTTFQMLGCTIGRNEILARYWELSSIDPKDTKDTLTGQLKALDSLCEQLTLKPATAAEVPVADYYRAKWNVEAQ